MNTSKIHLHLEQFSLKTNWKVTEGLPYNRAVRKIHVYLGRVGRKVIGLGRVPLGGDSEEEGDSTGGHGHPPWEVIRSSHRLCVLVLVSYV